MSKVRRKCLSSEIPFLQKEQLIKVTLGIPTTYLDTIMLNMDKCGHGTDLKLFLHKCRRL